MSSHIYFEDKNVHFFKSDDKSALISQIEVNDHCVTIYGRVRDNSKKWAPEMARLIAAVRPDTTVHLDPETRAMYHPLGSVRKTNYPYIHHVHSPRPLKDTLKLVANWLPDDLKNVGEEI